ncbi:MAG: M56 family metallopeptidase [Pseudomonadota bacterium]|nr:M56 family metallopeptidase [Pseudomonadota bacterium]
MIQTLVHAAGVTLAGTTLLCLLVLAFDRFAPARFVRERHDLGVAVYLTVPLLFALACLPRAPEVPELVVPVAVTGAFEVGGAAAPAELRPATGAATPLDAARDGWSLQAALPPVLAPLFLTAWVAGAVIALVVLLRDLRALSRLKAGARPATPPPALNLSHRVAMAYSDRVSLPLLAGFFRPTILLPAGFALDRDARPVLEHEIAHAVRHDVWTALGIRLVTIVFWWALPLRAVRPVIDQSREILCDRWAARVTGAPRSLASALLDAAETAVRTPSLTLAAAPTRSGLARRIGQLTNPETLKRKDSAMRFSLILPVLAAGSLAFTPHVGAVTAGADAPTQPSRSLDDSLDRDASLFMAAARGQSERVDALLEDGADPNVRFSGDGTALIAAARDGDARSVALLLEAGADPDLGSSGDGNPLIAAAGRGDIQTVDLLLEAGADIDRGESGDGNALIAASLKGRAAVVRHLLDRGADPNGYVQGDETPLINAAQKGDIGIADMLVEAGADVSLTVFAHDRNGRDIYRSPLSEARRNRHSAMVSWLEARGAQHLPPQ